MAETVQMGLPLLAAAQAQKHVTMNEALARLDALVPMAVVSRVVATPPLAAEEGDVWAVPAGASGDWAGQEGQLALRAGGGWVFARPKAGWRVFLRDEGVMAVHDGLDWVAGALTLAPSGAGTTLRVIEVDHVVSSGATSSAGVLIPAGAVVIGVTARVVTALSGSAGAWRLGNPGATDRYGSGLGMGAGSWARGVLGQPTAFYSPTEVVLTAEGGTFAGGMVRIAVHLLELSLPG